MYSQNDETGILEVLENKISFAAQLWWEDLYRILQKKFCVFYNSVVVHCEFLEKKSNKSQNFYFYHYQCSQNIQKEIGNCKKSNML